jgi:hypothetical protein
MRGLGYGVCILGLSLPSVPADIKKSPDGPNGRQVQRKQTGSPGPCTNSQEITMESMLVLPLEES